VLWSATYRRLLDAARERDKLLRERDAYEESARRLAHERDRLEEELGRLPQRVEAALDERVAAMNVSRRRFEQLAQDRQELVALYIEKLYALACRFAYDNVATGHSRGLLIILVDRQNADPRNFSAFHEGQQEYLEHDEFRGVERTPHIFSPVAGHILEYMGGKELRLNGAGNVLGYEERDGALLVDLRGVIYRTRQMVEGVESHKVNSRVERLMRGSARHSAAIYASALDEVLVAIVVSEETNHVTVFRDGKFLEAHDPHEARVITREEYFGGPPGKPRLPLILPQPPPMEALDTVSEPVED
jgi:hypothetical protein